MMPIRAFIALGALLMVALAAPPARSGEARTLRRCGAGFLEEVNGYKVLHLKGDPYELGYQHGALLKDDIRALVRFILDEKMVELRKELDGKDPKAIIKGIAKVQEELVPQRFHDELRGLADGSGVPHEEIVLVNFLPELFHCSGFAIGGKATKGGAIYHGRNLDYACDWTLQDHAVLTIVEPTGAIPFANISYAGFIGSVTGMNAERISIGEIGGDGQGHWGGLPMALLVRMALEGAKSLDEAVAVFRDNPRTCEYYYVIADGESGEGVGLATTWESFATIPMGGTHFESPEAVEDAVLISSGDHYKELVKRVRAGSGSIDADAARGLLAPPVAFNHNLHSVLFETNTLRFWIANASESGGQAAIQPYHAFKLDDLLRHRADPAAPALSGPAIEGAKAPQTSKPAQ